jgi:hypothetical protein
MTAQYHAVGQCARSETGSVRRYRSNDDGVPGWTLIVWIMFALYVIEKL